MNEIKSWAGSSMDSNKISLTVQAITKCAIFIVGYFAVSKGFDPMDATTQVQAISDIVISLIPAVLAVYHGGEAIYGIVRKFFVVK
jgi:hypothetical protein